MGASPIETKSVRVDLEHSVASPTWVDYLATMLRLGTLDHPLLDDAAVDVG
jgi:hypothetical protein